MSREPDSLLKRTWSAIQSQGTYSDPDCVNRALSRVIRSLPHVIDRHSLPPPENKLRWKKEIINPAAHAETTAWTREHIKKWGRVAEYSYIATELSQDQPAYRQFPTYLTTLGLKKSERRNIALFRIQATQYVATHASFRDTQLYGKQQHYQRRYCIWKDCEARCLVDDTAHVLLHCPLHRAEREKMLARVKTALLAVGLTMDIVPTDTMRVQLLLGSPPEITRSALACSPTAYRDILRASAAFIRAVYGARWARGHKLNRQHRDNAVDETGGGNAAGS